MLDKLIKKAKKISKDIILVNVGIIALGIFLVLYPGGAKDIICRIIGGILSAWGIFKIFEYLIVKMKTSNSIAPLVGGCILLGIGVYVLISPALLSAMITIALASILFIGAVFKLQYALLFSKNESKLWWIQAVGAILLIITSVIAFINPFGGAGNIIMIFIGIALIADGAWDLMTILYISKFMQNAGSDIEKTVSSSSKYVDTTAEDKTE